jgi:hypothetical protein
MLRHQNTWASFTRAIGRLLLSGVIREFSRRTTYVEYPLFSPVFRRSHTVKPHPRSRLWGRFQPPIQTQHNFTTRLRIEQAIFRAQSHKHWNTPRRTQCLALLHESSSDLGQAGFTYALYNDHLSREPAPSFLDAPRSAPMDPDSTSLDEADWQRFIIATRRDALTGDDGQTARLSRSSAPTAVAPPFCVVRTAETRGCAPRRIGVPGMTDAVRSFVLVKRWRGSGISEFNPGSKERQSENVRNDEHDRRSESSEQGLCAHGGCNGVCVLAMSGSNSSAIHGVDSGSSSGTLVASISSDELFHDNKLESRERDGKGLLRPFETNLTYDQSHYPTPQS